MKSYKSRKLPYIEAEKNIFIRESPKKILLNSEKIKDTTTTASLIPSCISTSQEYQIENNKFPKSKSSKKQNQPKNDFIIFKSYLNPIKNSVLPKKQKDNKNNLKKTLSVDKIGKNHISIINNNKNNTKSFIENNLNKKENVKNEMNEIIQNFVDNNLQNNKNCNFFRLFKMKRKNQNNNNISKEEIFPPLYVNYPPLETEQNILDRKNGNKYLNLFTNQNEDKKNTIHFRDTLINSVNKNKENKIFIKIDEHFNKLNNDKSPKIIKKNYQCVIKNIKSNNINNNINNGNINNLINISSNKNIKNISKDENYSNINFKSLTNEKNIENKDNKIKEINLIKNLGDNNNRTPSCEEKTKNLYHKKNKNRLKIKIITPISNNIFANKDEFNLDKNKEKTNINRYRNNTPNIIINNNIINSCQIKNNNKKNKLHFELDIKKIKNKKIETIDDNNIADSFREELNILISDVNNSEKEKNDNKNVNETDTKDKKNDFSIEECVDEIKININDEFIEKKIPKEEKERINLIKKFNRPETPSKK